MRIRGAIEQKTSRLVNGWLAITQEPGPIVVEVLHGGVVVGRIEATQMRPDVRDAGFGGGGSGLAFKMPPRLEDVDPDDIELRLQGTEIYLAPRRGEALAEKPTTYGEGCVFILGPARSGTSVMFLALQKVLGLSGLGESHVPQIFQRMAFQFYDYVKEFSGQEGVLAHQLQEADFRAHLIRYLRQFYYDQFNGEAFVDKTPGLEALVGAPFLREAFPAAKIIVMERNGVETIESYRRKFGATFEEALKEWAECSCEAEKLKVSLSDVLFVNQHKLHCDPMQMSERLAQFLGHYLVFDELGRYFAANKIDVTSESANTVRVQNAQDVGWSGEYISLYRDALRLIGISSSFENLVR